MDKVDQIIRQIMENFLRGNEGNKVSIELVNGLSMTLSRMLTPLLSAPIPKEHKET